MRLEDVAFFPHGKRDHLLDASVWRYVKLSTLLTMIQQKEVFIPTLRKLQSEDPCEGRLVKIDDIPGETLRKLDSNDSLVQWLLDRARPEEAKWLQQSKHKAQFSRGPHAHYLLRIMHRELAKRRCVWCWYEGKHGRFEHGFMDKFGQGKIGESMALWQIYGYHGVALRSSIGRLIKALVLPRGNRLLVCNVCYDKHRIRSDYAGESELPYRPVVLKDSSYEHEREVRLVFKVTPVDPDLLMGEADGIHLQLKNTRFIEEVVVSPSFPLSEQLGLAELLGKLLPTAKVRISEVKNPSHDKGWFTVDNQRECRKSLRRLAFEAINGDPEFPV